MSSVLSIAGNAVASVGTAYATAAQVNELQSQAAAAKVQGNVNKTISDYNATVARNNAAYARNAAAVNVDIAQRNAERTRAAAKVAGAGAGVDVTQGSPVMADMDSAANAELNVLRIKYAGEEQARNFEAQAGAFEYQGSVAQTFADYQASFYSTEAETAGIVGDINAMAQLLSGSTQAYMAMTPSGAPNTSPYNPGSSNGTADVSGGGMQGYNYSLDTYDTSGYSLYGGDTMATNAMADDTTGVDLLGGW